MRLVELHIKAFGPFTDQVIPLGNDKQRLVLVHGLNEAGKSSALRAIAGLRFGMPTQTPDNFLHDYPKMRVGGVFVDAQGKQYSLMRRKGSGVTLKFVDFAKGGVELLEPVPPEINRLLTNGLSVEDYQSMFGLDHDTLRKGGIALVKGEGEIGAALFEASSGVGDVSRILGDLDATAKKFFMPAAHAKNARINQSLSEYKTQFEHYKEAQIKPTKWEAIANASRNSHAALENIQQEFNQTNRQQLLVKELIAVSPILAALKHANTILDELDQVSLLAEVASTERATAEAGLSEAIAEASTNDSVVKELRVLVDQIELDPVILTIAQSVTRLHAAVSTIVQLRGQIALAEGDIVSRIQALNAIAGKIEPNLEASELVHRAPTATDKARINGCIVALEEAERALTQHRLAAPNQAASPDLEPRAVPDVNLQAAVRVALEEVAKNDAILLRLSRLPNEIKAAERATKSSLVGVGLPDEPNARHVRPLLGAAVDDAIQRLTALCSKRTETDRRVEEMQEAIAKQQDAINNLLAHGHVPTHEEVRYARAHRQEGWALVKAMYIEGTKPDVQSFAESRPLPEAYEQAVSEADSRIDGLASDTGRVTKLEAAQRQLAELDRDLKLRLGEIHAIDAEQQIFKATWENALTQAGIPIMPPAELRDWQDLLTKVLAAFDELQTKRDELQHAQDIEKALADKLFQAITRLGLTKVDKDDPLGTLVAVAEDNVKQVNELIASSNNAAGQTLQLLRQAEIHKTREIELVGDVGAARSAFSGHIASLMLCDDATIAMAKARMAEFDELLIVHKSLVEAQSRLTTHAGTLSVYQDAANSIAAALSEPLPEDMTLSAELWSARLVSAQSQKSRLELTEQRLSAAEQNLSNNQSKAARHEATLNRLCKSAGVRDASELPEAEEKSNHRRQAMRDANAASEQLAKASRRNVNELQELLAGRDHESLRTEESRIEQELIHISERIEKARIADETARRELDSIDSSDAAASASDAMARAIATVRNTLPLQIRTRLAHALLQEAVNRFRERSQAPMLKSASGYFAQITGGEFEGLINDDSNNTPVIAAKRPGGASLSVEAMSEGTRDQLYLALRMAALKLQRERGVDLPVILDDVLMASDDVRAGCIFKALADFSTSGQVIVFTHHHHLCDVARKNVVHDAIALVELKRI
ncbi:MAG: AAA family ATPase [Nitrosomonas sp.]|nr:AAA family ATPase [Nitrosomonas sp.]